MTRIASALGLALLMSVSGCATKKAAPAQPVSPAPPAAPPAPDAQPGSERMVPPPSRAPAPGARKPSDPCSGGELR